MDVMFTSSVHQLLMLRSTGTIRTGVLSMFRVSAHLILELSNIIAHLKESTHDSRIFLNFSLGGQHSRLLLNDNGYGQDNFFIPSRGCSIIHAATLITGLQYTYRVNNYISKPSQIYFILTSLTCF